MTQGIKEDKDPTNQSNEMTINDFAQISKYFFPPIISDYSDIQMADLPMLNGTINNDEALIF